MSLGGSVLVAEDGVRVDLLRDLGAILARLSEERRLLAVVGGGPVARRYIGAGRELGLDEARLDDIGIAVTRLNARLLAAAVPGACLDVPDTHDEAVHLARSWPVVVMGGTHAGHTTDAVAAMLAEKSGAARLVIATNVDGVYTADPRANPDAERLPELTADELVRITFNAGAGAGSAGVVDPLAARLIARSGIATCVVKGTDLKALEAALAGATFDGSRILPRAP